MKKQIIIAIIAFFGIVEAKAQVTFKPGLRGGLNLSHFTKGDLYNNNYYYDGNGNYVNGSSNTEFNSKVDFYLGFYGAIRLTKYYTLQPEIDYSRQGSKIKYIDRNNRTVSENIDFSYISAVIVNKFTFTDKFNVHFGPTLDVITEHNTLTDSDIDLAFILGTGYNFTKNFGLEARIKKGIIPAYYNSNYNNGSYSSGSHTNVVFSLGATYTFDLK
jgi:hypothetical protein